MNSAVERRRLGAPWIVVAGLGLAGLLFAAGCADHGPTNLYSQPLFGQHQSGAHLEVSWVGRTNLTVNPSTTDDVGFNVYLKNTGSGGTAGPVYASLAVSGCATVDYSPTAIFGTPGDVIQPGDVLQGQMVDSAGNILGPYTFQATYDLTSPCAGSPVTFTVTATDPFNHSWNSNFFDTAN